MFRVLVLSSSFNEPCSAPAREPHTRLAAHYPGQASAGQRPLVARGGRHGFAGGLLRVLGGVTGTRRCRGQAPAFCNTIRWWKFSTRKASSRARERPQERSSRRASGAASVAVVVAVDQPNALHGAVHQLRRANHVGPVGGNHQGLLWLSFLRPVQRLITLCLPLGARGMSST